LCCQETTEVFERREDRKCFVFPITIYPMPDVSVLMPCYNTSATLEHALRSLTSQTLKDFELVAVDDGSTDDTPKILMDWAAVDSRLRVIRIEHRGIVTALNAGLEAVRSLYIARMDADDRSHPERLARQVAFLRAHPEIALVSCLVSGFPAEKLREGLRIYLDWLNILVEDADIQREIFVESPLPHPSVMLRKEWLEKIGGYQDRGWPEDYDLWMRLYLAGAHFAKLPEVLLDWRDDPNRLTRTDPRYSLENFLRLKAYYLSRGPLAGRDAVFIWGAGMIGRRLSKHLLRQGCPITAFFDIDPHKIGSTRRGLPVLPPEDFPKQWSRCHSPVVLAAVGARGARPLIRQRLNAFGLREGLDWWGVA
jgi:glycosyltransferase involved in cell wall biosynthesis